MKGRFANGLMLGGAFGAFGVLTAGCAKVIGEDFNGYHLKGYGGAGAGAPSDAARGGTTSIECNGITGCAGGTHSGGSAGLPGCQPNAAIVPECESTDGQSFPLVSLPPAKGVMMLSAEQYGGGFQAFASKRGSSLLAQLWNTTAGEPAWTPWLCFDSLPQPDRLAGHALPDGTQEVFATTLCGGLYRRVEQNEPVPVGWLSWVPFSLPPAGQAVTDVAMSEASDDTDIIYVADAGRVFARPRLGNEASSTYADWHEISGVSHASLVTAGLRSDQRQQVFMIDGNGTVFTAIQSTSALDSAFGSWSNFDSSELPAPLVDIEAPLGGPLPLEVFAVDSNGTLWQRAQDETSGVFGPWRAWDGPSPPSNVTSVSGAGLKLAPDAPMRLTVLTKAGSIYTSRRTSNVWGDWRLFP